MQLIGSFSVLSTLFVSGALAFKPQTQNGVYHYHHGTGKHTKIGHVQQATGKVKIPSASGNKPKAKGNGKSGVRARAMEWLSENGMEIDFDLLAGRDLLDEDDLDTFLARAMGEEDPEMGALVEREGSSGISQNESGCGRAIVPSADFGNAYEAFAIACSKAPTADSRTSIYAVSGSAMVYMCNYATNFQNPCREPELFDQITFVLNKCPNYQVGWAQDTNWWKSYGYDVAGTTQCGF